MPGGTDAQCINGVSSGSFNVCGGNDGPGVAHDAFASSGFTVGSLLLFTITYKVMATGSSSVAFPESTTSGSSINHVFDTSGLDIIASETGGLYGTPVAFDYSLSNSGPVTIQQGVSGTVTITATLSAGTAQPVTLSCVSSSLPTGITCGSFTLNPVTPTGSSGLTVNVASSVAAGPHSFMVTGSPLGATTTPTTVAVTVTAITPPPGHSTKIVVTCSPGSVLVNAATSCTARVIDTSASPNVPSGTVTFTTNSSGDFTPSASCALAAGKSQAMAACSLSYTPTVAGHHMITGSYGGDSGHAGSSGSFTVNVRPSLGGGPVLLTFNGFDADDFDNGIGQLDVLVNGQLVVDVPAGLNHLTGSGDYESYANAAVDFGPFDVTAFLVTGQNTVLFKDPTSSDHFSVVSNVLIVQGSTVLLSTPRARGVSPSSSFAYTFSSPPLTVDSFTITPARPTADQFATLTATYSGGTGPFRCIFRFGDSERASVIGSNGTCSVVHDYDILGDFTATVTVRGASTSDSVTNSLKVTVTSDPSPGTLSR